MYTGGEVVDTIKEAFELFSEMELPLKECEVTIMHEAALPLIGYIEHLEAAQPKWISVEERMPEPFVSVIVHMPQETPCPTVHEGYRTNDGRWYSAHFVREFDEITHWMPLPEPPKEDTND